MEYDCNGGCGMGGDQCQNVELFLGRYKCDEEEGECVSKIKWSSPPLSVSKTVYYMCKREVIETSTQDRPGNEARSEYTWSVIVNISAGAADLPLQLNTVYSATKKFDSHFSDALRKEYSSKGIIVQDVKPHLVATVMTRTTISLRNVPENTRSAPDPITYARAAVATIGIQHTTHGYFYHALRAYLARQFPVWLLDWVMWKPLLDIRDAYLKTKAKQK